MEKARVRSVNVGRAKPIAVKSGFSAIDKRPVADPVPVGVPGPGASGLAGDDICDVRNHGGPDQAVYAYAAEDLARWGAELGRPLVDGQFGENLTTTGVDVNAAVIGELWHVGPDLVLQATVPRIPCRTFAVWLDERGWMKTFTQRALPGAYFRVVRPGAVTAGDEIVVTDRPEHGLTIGYAFRATTLEADLLPALDVDGMPDELREKARRRARA
ncbi:MOSC domain-containing protein [Actinokineospora bangkokensis]|uniref:MOSC domain-containing protein n=1 Tax=Actinokineospora bangkokensis TaxID=1193682 RepID=A0A1Q9LRH4_9PSEU|nr:MOSC domain-containing protein [Actinokineospora bangkokensis]OLR94622.1 MOSC domain-containing protein [Actinokineospora bangkokensis]